MVAGLIENLHNQWLYPKWHKCVIDQKVLETKSKDAYISNMRNTIEVTEIGKNKILWILVEREDNPIWIPYVLEYKPSRSKTTFVPWMKLTDVTQIPALYNEVLAPPVPSTEAEEHVNDFLREMTLQKKEVAQVTCEVSIDAKMEKYRLVFKDKSDYAIQDTLLFEDTLELVKKLRHPIRIGTPQETRSGSVVMWDHRKDIQYSDHELVQGETISLTFLKPMVHRSRFYQEAFHYPKTCIWQGKPT